MSRGLRLSHWNVCPGLIKNLKQPQSTGPDYSEASKITKVQSHLRKNYSSQVRMIIRSMKALHIENSPRIDFFSCTIFFIHIHINHFHHLFLYWILFLLLLFLRALCAFTVQLTTLKQIFFFVLVLPSIFFHRHHWTRDFCVFFLAFYFSFFFSLWTPIFHLWGLLLLNYLAFSFFATNVCMYAGADDEWRWKKRKKYIFDAIRSHQ